MYQLGDAPTQILGYDILDVLVPVCEAPPDDLFPLGDGHGLDVDLVGDELVGGPPDLFVNVQGSLHHVGQGQPVGADAFGDRPPKS